MAEDKPNKSLGARIAAALLNGEEADRDTLTALWTEVADESDALREAIKVEEARLQDIANPDPDKSAAVIASAKLRIERLGKVIHEQLEPRVEALDRAADLVEWHEEADRLQAETDELWSELETAYNTLCDQLIDVWHRVARNSAAIDAAHRRRPSGVRRELVGADHPQLRASLRLPHWDDPGRIRFPRDEAWEFQVATTNAMVAQAKALEQKCALMHGPDWWAAKQIEDERLRAESARRDEEAKAKAEADRKAFYRAQQEADRRRRLGITG